MKEIETLKKDLFLLTNKEIRITTTSEISSTFSFEGESTKIVKKIIEYLKNNLIFFEYSYSKITNRTYIYFCK